MLRHIEKREFIQITRESRLPSPGALSYMNTTEVCMMVIVYVVVMCLCLFKIDPIVCPIIIGDEWFVFINLMRIVLIGSLRGYFNFE